MSVGRPDRQHGPAARAAPPLERIRKAHVANACAVANARAHVAEGMCLEAGRRAGREDGDTIGGRGGGGGGGFVRGFVRLVGGFVRLVATPADDEAL